MQEHYRRSWSTRNPGYLLILLDQYGGMDKKFGAGMPLAGHRMSDILASVTNGFIQEVILSRCVAQVDGSLWIRSNLEMSILGYGGSVSSALGGALAGKPVVTLEELSANPVVIERHTLPEINPITGDVIERTIGVPIWVRPRANGLTPLCAALRRAGEFAREWVARHAESFPPIVINITTGQPQDGSWHDFMQAAEELTQVQTTDGQTLLFTVHLSEYKEQQIVYPLTEEEVSKEYLGKLFFTVSSVLPFSMLPATGPNDAGQPIARPGARGLIYNGDALSMRQMLHLAVGWSHTGL
jgi:hypothetical protein